LRAGKVIAKKAVCSFLAHPVYDQAPYHILLAYDITHVRQASGQ